MAGILENWEGFDWDEANSNKNWYLHRVTDGECEEIFFNIPLVIARGPKGGSNEQRFFGLGRTDAGRRLFAAFTLRNSLIRIISARAMTKGELEKYAEKEKRDSGI